MKKKQLQINQWLIDIESGDVFDTQTHSHNSELRVEPQGIKLLVRLAECPHELVDKETLVRHIWPDVVVTDDALTRCVSRVRKQLGDDPKQPQIIETLPKRGYRLIAADLAWQTPAQKSDVSGSHQSGGQAEATKDQKQRRIFAFRTAPEKKVKYLLGLTFIIMVVALVYWQAIPENAPENDEVSVIIEQGDDFYHQIRRQDNEMAIAMYERAIALRPDNAAGQAGLANALVQQVIRWPGPANDKYIPEMDMSEALKSGRTRTTDSQAKLERALALASGAVRLAPQDPKTHKALGFVHSARGEFEQALASYDKALALNEHAWDVLINMGDLSEISGDLPSAMPYYERAFDAMGKVYGSQSARVQPWYANLAATLGDKYASLEDFQKAEVWYRHTLSIAPFHGAATRGLADLLERGGDPEAAARLCTTFLERIGENPCVTE